MGNKQLIESLEYHLQEFANKKKGKPGRPWPANHLRQTPEQKKAYQKQWREANKDYHKQYYQNHKKPNSTGFSNKSRKPLPPDWDADFNQPLTRRDAPDVYDAWDEYNQ